MWSLCLFIFTKFVIGTNGAQTFAYTVQYIVSLFSPVAFGGSHGLKDRDMGLIPWISRKNVCG